MRDNYIQTAESVTEGHPDKLCDTIADRVLDACLEHDPNARVACEVMATAGKIIVAGEITARQLPDIPAIVCQTVRETGYDSDYEVEVITHDQSGDIAGAVDSSTQLGAGDQGIMYGYVGLFTGRITRGPKKGMVRSFPICGKCAVQRDCKMKPIRQYQKSLTPDTVRYVGIAKDEQERLMRLGDGCVSLLEKYNFTEQDARELCLRAGLLSPVYEFTNRGGCWFCPNAKKAELRHLYDHHPDLWNRMLELQAIPGKASEKFNRTQTFADIDAMFRQEDSQMEPFQEAA